MHTDFTCVIKIIDISIAATASSAFATLPANVKANEQVLLSGAATKDGVPALAYHWNFSDGVTADGTRLTHAYTDSGPYNV